MSRYLPCCARQSEVWILLLLLAGLGVQSSAAQHSSPYVARIFHLTMSRYTCTALTKDHQLEQVTIRIDAGVPQTPEFRRGSATDDDEREIEELTKQPQILAGSSDVRRPSAIVKPDGKWLMVLANVHGETKSIDFLDPDGTQSIPEYLKPFDAFADAVRRRKLPKISGNARTVCSLTATER